MFYSHSAIRSIHNIAASQVFSSFLSVTNCLFPTDARFAAILCLISAEHLRSLVSVLSGYLNCFTEQFLSWIFPLYDIKSKVDLERVGRGRETSLKKTSLHSSESFAVFFKRSDKRISPATAIYLPTARQ